jgi:hypothetical protein
MMKMLLARALAAALIIPTAVEAAQPYACGGAALAGGAQLICSHIDPTAPPQSCSFFWSLMSTDDTTSVVQGRFYSNRERATPSSIRASASIWRSQTRSSYARARQAELIIG